MKFMFSQSLVQVPVKYVSVQCRGGLITVLYGNKQAYIIYLLKLVQNSLDHYDHVWDDGKMFQLLPCGH